MQMCVPEARKFPVPLWIEDDEPEPAPLPGMPPERQRSP